MTKEEARNYLLDYAYNELNEPLKSEFEAILKTDASLRQELTDVTGTRSLLQHLEAEAPAEQLVMMPEQAPAEPAMNWWTALKSVLFPSGPMLRGAYALCLVVMVVVGASSFTSFTAYQKDGQWMISIGNPPVIQEGLTNEQVLEVVNQVQQENVLFMTRYMDAVQLQQQDQFEQAITQFANYLEERRLNDLELISNDLTTVQENTANRFIMNEQLLDELIQTLAYSNQ
ncbi:MAG: hypothetical protein AAFW89_07675 [Bacteroidota bacterium]